MLFILLFETLKKDSALNKNISEIAFIDKAKGALLGLALGDALGTTLEFKPKDSFEPIHDMIGGGPFGLRAGQWTDDTSMALCLAESLLCQGKMDTTDQMQRYVRWWKQGENSVTGHCFDIGITVSGALNQFINTGNPLCGSSDEFSASNGSLMRLAPVCIFSHPYKNTRLTKALSNANLSSITTHAEQRCVEACQVMAWLMYQLFLDSNISKAALFKQLKHAFDNLHPEIQAIVNGSYLEKDRSDVRGTGFVVHSLEAALWCFAHSDNFEQGALMAANLGDDADTTAAIYGQLAGTFYGIEQLPQKWLSKLYWREEIEMMAQLLATTPSLRQVSAFIADIRAAPVSNKLSVLYQAAYQHKILLSDYAWTDNTHNSTIGIPLNDSSIPSELQKKKRVLIATMGLSDCCRAITSMTPGGRFCGGLWDNLCVDGTIQLWLNRLCDLTGEVHISLTEDDIC